MLKTCVPFDELEVAMGNALEAGPAGACMGAEGPMIRLLLYMAGTCECDTRKIFLSKREFLGFSS